MLRRILSAAACAAAMMTATAVSAGPVFLTGHDPDYHAQGQGSGQRELQLALSYVTGGTYNDNATKFLWVESFTPAYGGHLVGYNGLSYVGVTSVNVDWVDAAGFAGVNLSNYSAIVVASTFGGMLTDAELVALQARKAAIASFVNGGGGLAAFSECGFGMAACNTQTVTATSPLFGFVPVGAISASTAPPYTLTQAGVNFGLDPNDINDCCTHNSFSAVGGLTVLDFDQNGNATTLAGNVKIGGGGFGVPEPGTWALMLLGFAGAGAALRRQRRRLAHV